MRWAGGSHRASDNGTPLAVALGERRRRRMTSAREREHVVAAGRSLRSARILGRRAAGDRSRLRRWQLFPPHTLRSITYIWKNKSDRSRTIYYIYSLQSREVFQCFLIHTTVFIKPPVNVSVCVLICVSKLICAYNWWEICSLPQFRGTRIERQSGKKHQSLSRHTRRSACVLWHRFICTCQSTCLRIRKRAAASVVQ